VVREVTGGLQVPPEKDQGASKRIKGRRGGNKNMGGGHRENIQERPGWGGGEKNTNVVL